MKLHSRWHLLTLTRAYKQSRLLRIVDTRETHKRAAI